MFLIKSLERNWLEDYASRISISWVVFVFVGILAVLSALATIGFHAIKAAMETL